MRRTEFDSPGSLSVFARCGKVVIPSRRRTEGLPSEYHGAFKHGGSWGVTVS